MSGKKVALALGSGGARGYAHIGVIDELTQRGYDIVTIAGTSMGSVIGALTAAGKLEEFTAWVTPMTSRDVWRLLDPSLSMRGAIRADKVIGGVSEIIGPVPIEDFPIPFTAVATDLGARREVWFQDGPVDLALRASIAIPSVIVPVNVGGRILVDGGVLNPVPVEPTTAVASDLTVAVSLNGMPGGTIAGSPVRTDAGGRLDEFTGRVRSISQRFASREKASDVGPRTPAYDDIPKELTVVEQFNRSFDAMSSLITRYRMAANPPDVLITVPADVCRTMDFHRASEVIEIGRRLAVEAFDAAGL